ncbi:hypothetical protein BH20CHL6_BH20CHL6_18400 [soil metagenome]
MSHMTRRLLVWAGIALFGLIALTATLQALQVLGMAASRLADPVVQLGLGLTLAFLGAVASLVVASGRWSSASPRRETLAIWAGLALVVTVRVAVALLVDAPVDRDMRYYDETAAGFARGGCCFLTRPVGYPLLLAGAYVLIGRGPLAGEILNIGAALAGAIVLAAVVRRAFNGPAAAVTVVLYALWPAGALMSSARMAETVYTSQLLFAVGAAVMGGTAASWGLITGAILGASQYVRAISVAFVPVFLLVRLARRPAPRRSAVLSMAGVVV